MAPKVTDTGASISVPVGDGVKGHVFNALGDCLDEPGYGRTASTGPSTASPGLRRARAPHRDAETGI